MILFQLIICYDKQIRISLFFLFGFYCFSQDIERRTLTIVLLWCSSIFHLDVKLIQSDVNKAVFMGHKDDVVLSLKEYIKIKLATKVS